MYTFSYFDYNTIAAISDIDALMTYFSTQYALTTTVECFTELHSLYYTKMMESTDIELKNMCLQILNYLENEGKTRFKGAKRKYFLEHRFDAYHREHDK